MRPFRLRFTLANTTRQYESLLAHRVGESFVVSHLADAHGLCGAAFLYIKGENSPSLQPRSRPYSRSLREPDQNPPRPGLTLPPLWVLRRRTRNARLFLLGNSILLRVMIIGCIFAATGLPAPLVEVAQGRHLKSKWNINV